MTAINYTPTDPSADGFVSEAEVTAYLSGRIEATKWEALDDDQKAAHIRLATISINGQRFGRRALYDYNTTTTLAQALKFPDESTHTLTATVTAKTDATVTLSYSLPIPSQYYQYGALRVNTGAALGAVLYITSQLGAVITVSSTAGIEVGDQVTIVRGIPLRIKQATMEQVIYVLGGGLTRAVGSNGVKSYSIGDLSETYEDAGSVGGGSMILSPITKMMLKGLISRSGQLI